MSVKRVPPGGESRRPQPTTQALRAYRCEGISHRYGSSAPPVLQDVSLSVERGVVHGVVGHNGAGKSTLLGILAGQLRPTSGALFLDGEQVSFATPREALDQGVVAVYQELSLVPTLSVQENLLAGRKDRGRLRRSRRARRAFLEELIELFALDARQLSTPVGELRFGARQRVEIARALSRESRYLLLDEPTAGLDEDEVVRLFGILERIAAGKDPVGVLMVNHHIDQVFEVCHRVTVLRDGLLVEEGEGREVDRERLVQSLAGNDLQAPRVSIATGGGDVAGDEDANVDGTTTAGTGATPRGALEISALLVDGLEHCEINVDVAAGTILGAYGLEGGGQDLMLEAILGERRVLSGSIVLGGEQLGRGGVTRARRSGVLFLSGDRSRMVVPQLSAVSNAIMPRVACQRLSSLTHRQGKLVSRARGALTTLDVRGSWEGPISGLSGGNQQKVILARALTEDFRLLLLLEPTVGVDVAARRRLINEIRQIASEKATPTVVASTHEEDLLELCDRIVVFVERQRLVEVAVTDRLDRRQLRSLALGSHPTGVSATAGRSRVDNSGATAEGAVDE